MAGAMIELKTPEDIPYRIEIMMSPEEDEAPNMQKQRMELMRHVMNKRFRGP